MLNVSNHDPLAKVVPNSVEKTVPDVYKVDDTEPVKKAVMTGGAVTTGGDAEKSDAREDEVSFVPVVFDPEPWKGVPKVELPKNPCAMDCSTAALEYAE
ncbi:MAG: hypothetical protein Q9157_006094 [Trypethelium eluteriae]